MAGCPSKMSSFSIDSILALQETKCGTAQDNDIRKNINALSIEELREEDVSTSKCRERRSSPSSSPIVGIEDSSYEGKILTIFYSELHVFSEFVTFWQIYSLISVAKFIRLGNQNHSTLGLWNGKFVSESFICKRNLIFEDFTQTWYNHNKYVVP